MPFPSSPSSSLRPGSPRCRKQTSDRGFTLIELVMIVIILGVLAAVAVPRFVNLGTSARVASLKSFGGALLTGANNARALCKSDATCAYTESFYGSIGSRFVTSYYGWLDAGDSLNTGEIDSWVSYSGFTPVLEDPRTRFTLDGAPDPANCWVAYTQATGPGVVPTITMATTGC